MSAGLSVVLNRRRIAGLTLGLAFAFGTVRAQEPVTPSVVIVPWQGLDAQNLAADITAELRTRVDALGYFHPIGWEEVVDSLLTAGTLREPPPHTSCIVGRQIAVIVGIDYVLCGAVGPSPDGIQLSVGLFDMRAAAEIPMSPVVSNDREALMAHVLAELRSWGGPEGGR